MSKKLKKGFSLAVIFFVVSVFCNGAWFEPSSDRTFTGIQGTAWAKRAPYSKSRAKAREIAFTILFFNDIHGNLLPFTITKDDGTTAQVGGVATMAAMVKEIRAENSRKGIKTFLFIAGDVLQGTPLSTVFKGEPDIIIFNLMGVSAMTVGNHEFDFGLENFLHLKSKAAFPFISSNIVWKDDRRLMNEPAVSFPLGGGISLTVIGATTNELLTTTALANVEKLDVLDPLKTVCAELAKARPKGPVILLSHSKFQSDAEIARSCPGLTAIIGGHDHLLFEPVRIAAGVPVLQAFEKGRYIGRIDCAVNTATKRARIVKHAYLPVTPAFKPDPEIAAIVASYQSRLDATFKEVIGEARVFMDAERGRIRYEETNLGNYIADVMRANTNADIALINAGSIRASMNKGPVTIEDIFKIMPYPNELVTAQLSGSEIQEVLTRSVQGSREDEDGGFLQVSGVTFIIRGKKPEEITIAGQALDPAKIYTVAITDFMASGGDGYSIFKGKSITNTRLPLRELLVDSIRKQSAVEAAVEGRIVRKD